ncbi:hypothetical protein G4B88_013176 [Cannabis sativa]|uniref:Uncharacterized protein n=1 Tax=Cannabis sativa TaxID=3483 RepID=A0A7J6H1Q2_CANSA|nr:hypothetical protein G4B88_013176 [Cannabis sativa]
MSFFTGLIIGLAIGLVLVIAYARAHNARSMRRSDLAKTVAAFARMTVKDSKAILGPEFYPPWVLNWLNQHLKKLWPYINEATSDLIRSNVEPVLEQYRPVILSSLKFSKLTLGTVAPQFTGESECRGVTLELEIQWDGNPNIVLDVKTRVGVKLPIQVLTKLIFKPLVDDFPCFGAVSFSLREKKNLDFTLKVIGGDLSTLPGISDAIEETIRDAIEDSVAWPVRKIVPIIPGDYSDLELKPVGRLEVKLVQAKDLSNKDMVGKSDPFANNQLNPIWNEHFEFIVEDSSTQHLTIRIFDDEGIQTSELIGCSQTPLKDLEPGKVKNIWLKLVKDLEVQRDTKYRGEVQLELLYCPFGTESNIKNPFNPDYALTSLEKAFKSGIATQNQKKDVIVRGVLSVTVISAEDLPIMDLLGKADPYVILTMKKSGTKVKTRVLNENLNPIWNQTFDFVVEDALHEMLILEVWDHDTFVKEKIGRVIMTLTRALLEGEFQDSFPLENAKSGRLNLHFKWTPQPIFRDK